MMPQVVMTVPVICSGPNRNTVCITIPLPSMPQQPVRVTGGITRKRHGENSCTQIREAQWRVLFDEDLHAPGLSWRICGRFIITRKGSYSLMTKYTLITPRKIMLKVQRME
jgi:hypothetical protein